MRFCTNCGAEIGKSTPSSVPASEQSASDGLASTAAAFNLNPESARESYSNPDAEPSGDELTRAAPTVPRSQMPTVKGDSDIRAVSQIGRTIESKYRLDAVIGTGGMGSVYRATRLWIGDLVAIKLLHHEHVSGAQASERFRREAQAAARLKHPNAVSMYDFGVTNDGLVYLVMELVEGQSLRRVIKEQGPLKPAVAADIINQVCAALDEAHRQQIVHRDLKPDNIIVNAKITGLQVKVLDFGIAKLRDLKAGDLTQAGSILGTPHYMSPEQCLGEELDHRSDIYSLGIVLYEMLAGVVPFNSPSQHVHQAPPPLRHVNFDISSATEAVVLHALAKSREDRPQTARAFAAEFSAAVDTALPHNGGGQAHRSDVPNAEPMKTMVGMAPPPIGIGGPGQPYAGPVPPPKPNKPGRWIPFVLIGALLLAVGVIAGLLIDARNERIARDNLAPVSTPTPRVDNSTPEPTRPSPTPKISPSPSPTVGPSPPPPVSSNPTLPDSFQRSYQGTIGKGLSLRVALRRAGSDLTGRASTDSHTDTLSGTINPDGSFRLNGYENGQSYTGIYSGKIYNDGTIIGQWTSTVNGKKANFSLRQE
jgi:serine/threonine protein kinase